MCTWTKVNVTKTMVKKKILSFKDGALVKSTITYFLNLVSITSLYQIVSCTHTLEYQNNINFPACSKDFNLQSFLFYNYIVIITIQ